MVESDWEDGRHFTGTMTMMLVQYMQAQPRSDLLATVCAAAGEARDVDELSDVSGWSSYWQVRRLLEALDEATSRSAALRQIGMVAVAGVHAVDTTTVGAATATSTMLQDAGSLASMYRDIGIATGVLSAIVMAGSKEVGEN